MSNQQSDNGANLIIDALLARMSELDRFSDDEWTIGYHRLKVLDVVVDEDTCRFGLVHRVMPTDQCGRQLRADIIGGTSGGYVQTPPRIRTIYEIEGAAARAYLVKYLGDKKWL